MNPAFARYLSRREEQSTEMVDALIEKLDAEHETRRLITNLTAELRRQFGRRCIS